VKRILYLIYYFKELDWVKFNSFMDFVRKRKGVSSFKLWYRIVLSSLRYNISPLEYFQFHFYEIPDAEKETYAGTGFMYEYQLKMNPKGARKVLSDKRKFLKEYAQFVHHQHASLIELQEDPEKADRLLQNPSGKIVLKSSDGQCGIGVEVHSTESFSRATLIERLKESKNDLAEEFVVQHESLMKLSPSGLNTIRIITQLNHKDEIEILGARLRITVNSAVDNLAAGNLAAPINILTGSVEGAGVYSDVTKVDQIIHPITGISIVDFQVPYWTETMSMVKAAARYNKHNRSIGWDIAITNSGPELIEGNHDWCKLLWQLPVKQGLKHLLNEQMA
jgi:hypothetical protein